MIINTALFLQREKAPTKVILVTKDINMRLKAKGAGLKLVEDYRTDQLIDDVRFLYKGYYKFSVIFGPSSKTAAPTMKAVKPTILYPVPFYLMLISTNT